MRRVWLLAATLCTAAFGSSITYNYVGNVFDRCNGTTTGSGNCPANFTTDYIKASATFNAPLAGGLSKVDEKSSVTAWSIGDANGVASFSSSDANAVSELMTLSMSTDASGALTGWVMEGSNLVHDQYGTNLIVILNPTIIGGGTGLPFADGGNFNGGGNGGIGPPGSGYNPGNSVPGSWTETLNGFQGGSTSAPVFLLGGNPIGGVTGTIAGAGAEEFYAFGWGGGAFSATATITGATAPASFLFTEGLLSGLCSGGASPQTLNGGDSYSGTISIADLAPGEYCIGLQTNTVSDPGYSLLFNTPVSGVPEPSNLLLLSTGLGMIALARYARRKRQQA
jgi:hypothetical protein